MIFSSSLFSYHFFMAAPPKEVFPQTFQAYDIISNLPLGPSPTPTRDVPPRTIPAFLQRDYDILTNRKFRYDPSHDVDESEICLRDAARKLHGNFDPILQQFSDPQEDQRLAAFQSAQLVDEVVRKQISIPPTMRLRPSAFHDVVTNQPCSESARKFLEQISEHKFPYRMQRVEREVEVAEQDERNDAFEEKRKLDRINFRRFAEQLNRGFDILTNADHAFQSLSGRNFRPPWMPRVRQEISVAERLRLGGNSARSSAGPITTKRTARTAGIPRLHM
jgi:hypothetical protein